jgi:hypothetical protein
LCTISEYANWNLDATLEAVELGIDEDLQHIVVLLLNLPHQVHVGPRDYLYLLALHLNL